MDKQQLQQPLSSGFGAADTAEDIIKGIDLKGKTVIVTGGYSGIGLETTRVLQVAGANVIVPARDQQKASAAVKGLVGVELASMDLIDPASVDAFADWFIASGSPLHLLINSAGIMASPLVRDARGYESQFATNHLGHFQLAARLWPALLKAGGALDANGNPVLDPSKQMKTIAQGAATSVWCATSPRLADMGGVYCENSDVSPLIETANQEIGTSWGGVKMAERPTGALGVYAYAVDPDAAERLWVLSEKLTR